MVAVYGSLKEWMDLPVVIKPFVRYTGTGSKEFGEPIDKKCYAEGTVQVVKDNKGVEVVSNLQLYFDGDVPINMLDTVIFQGEEKTVISVSTFFRGGKPDLKVVYT